MARWFPWFTLSVFATLMAMSPVLAANEQAPSASDAQLALTPPPVVQVPALQPVTTTAADKSTLQLKPELTARAPFEAVWNSTLLAASSQSMGLQASRARGTNDHIRWTIAGAVVGAIVGAVAGDPLTDAAIGAAVGFGASYVMRR
jgi:hypothetical protein